MFARYSGYGIANFDIPKAFYNNIGSEAACVAACVASNPVNGNFQVTQYQLSSQQCACKYNSASTPPAFVAYAPENSALVGSCATYVKLCKLHWFLSSSVLEFYTN